MTGGRVAVARVHIVKPRRAIEEVAGMVLADVSLADRRFMKRRPLILGA